MAYVRWTKPEQIPPPLPSHISRTYIPSPNGALELLSAYPPASYTGPAKTPFFFQHGGFGHASVWLGYMTFFSQVHNIPCYALSVRGHGFSWYPSYFRMVYGTTKRKIADDLVTGIKYAQREQEESTGRKTEVVLVGHSSGGGLAQIILDAKDVHVTGLVLLAAIPCYGSLGVYWRWCKMDPFVFIRNYLYFNHPNSALSSLRLVKNAFFCPEMPDERVDAFAKQMSYYESLLWPFGMFLRFVNVKNIIPQILGWGTGSRVLFLNAEKDALIGIHHSTRAIDVYRTSVSQLGKEKKVEAEVDNVKLDEATGESEGNGVMFRIVKGAGHHVQNDLQWEDGAQKLLEFYEQL